VDRTTDAIGYVQDFTLSELRKLNASPSGFEPIPTFKEYCEWVVQTKLVTNVELKSSVIYYKGLEQKVIEMIHDYNLETKVIISSFNHLSVLEAQQIDPSIETAALVASPGLINGGFYCKKFNFTYLHPQYESVDASIIKECSDNGIGVNTWTVNTTEQLQHAIDIGISGIITNHPSDCIEYLHRQK